MSGPQQLIAVVDDDPGTRAALARVLSAANFDVHTFPSGEEFLRSLDTRLPDFLILDLHMPGLDGLQVQKRIAEAGIRLPLAIVTAHDSHLTRHLALTAGACAYLLKPVLQETLLNTINAALG